VKRRNWMGQQRKASQGRKALGPLAKRIERKRKSWTFERLEDRLVFSVSPTIQSVSFSNDTPEGAALTLLDEMRWSQMAAASATGQTVDTSTVKYQTLSLPNDPYFPNSNDPTQLYSQWYLLNIGQNVAQPDLQHLFGVAGQDLNVVPAWNMVDANGHPIDGTGVKVAVIDTGVQLFHPDLAANISPTLRFNSDNGTNIVSPNLSSNEGFHGTAVAGIIGAVGNNGEGGIGVAPGVTLVPIKADQTDVFGNNGFTDQSLESALLYALEHNIDITNNSLGPGGRQASATDPALLQILRDSVINGRGGLGMINVYAAGNDAGPSGTVGFPSLGSYSSASYNPLVNSRFTIGVGGVDHDGLYANADGTFTNYPESGPSVLVAAPTGNSILGATTIGDDDGFGSGIVTTDLFGDFGLNAAPLPSGFDPDRDFLSDPNYTSRMNGTSASTPMVSGVIALMLQANPNLTYRDVQEILVRSSRQNAQFEFPTSGGLGSALDTKNTWQTNQTGPFRNPDVHPNFGINPFYNFAQEAQHDPIADPSFANFGFFGFPFYAPDTNDSNRQESSVYEPQPALFTNGAGYTVSQGYGIYGEQLGYAHGVVDAAAAVTMAKQWHTLGQNINPNTELTYTTALVSVGGTHIPAAERTAIDHGDFLIPGGIGGISGFAAYWSEYYNMTPFLPTYTGKLDIDRGASYIDFAVPPSQQMDVEWVEVKVDLAGAGATSADGLNGLRIMLTSPDGTQSELNNYYPNASWAPFTTQQSATPANGWAIDFGQGLNSTPNQGHFVWTFSTNRSFGESSDSEVITHPVTGEPLMQASSFFDPISGTFITGPGAPIFRNWELHIENWSHSPIDLNGVEVVWHGKPIAGGKFDANYGDSGILSAQRVQGFVGIDQNGDNKFNFNRYVQTVADGLNGPHTDVSDIRTDDVVRQLDFNDNNHNDIYDEGDTINQEQFAANVIVDAYKVWNGVPEATPTARFLTGADGNYYFDLDVQGDLAQTKQLGGAHFGQTIEYQIRATDPLNRLKLNDITTPALATSDPAFTYLPHYKDTWTINPNWFFAADHDNPQPLGDNPGEVLFDPTGNAILTTLLDPTDMPEPGLPSPVPFNDNAQLQHIVPAPVKNLNFLLKQDAPANTFNVKGTVYSDVNGDGQFNGTDAAASNITVYWDKNRNGVHDSGELTVTTDASGNYTLPIDLSTLSPVPTQNATYQIGVIKPSSDWNFTDTNHDGVESIFAGPGSPDQIVNFFLQPPGSQNSNGNGPGSIQGVVYNDINNNHTQELGEPGAPNFRVFIDANLNGTWDSATETSVLTGINGTFFFSNVQPGIYRIDIVIANEGTPNASWAITSPTVGYRDVQLLPGATITGVTFGLDSLADSDWGDLPDSYLTTSAVNGPSHKVQLGFQLGATLDGEVNGQPGPGATNDTSDDGVKVISNGGVLKSGVNTLEVTTFGVGGLLTGWMDFNNDGHFDESERLLWTGGDPLHLNTNAPEADLPAGTWDLQVTIPAGAVDHRPVASRFRWGEQGLSFTGPAEIGEVEDYYFGLNFLLGDYNRDGIVDQADYNLWRKQLGQSVTPYAGSDGNGDGIVNQADFDVWTSHFGQTLLPGAGSGAGRALTAGENSNQNSSLSAASALSVDTFAGLEHSSSTSSTLSYNVLASLSATGSTSVAVAVSPSQNAAMLAAALAQVSHAESGVATSVATDSSVASAPVFSPFVTDTSFGSTSTSVVRSSTADSTSSNSYLLLLDQTWANMDDSSFNHDEESLYHDDSHEIVSTNDLALAAVLKEDDEQWDTI
jgi:subtilisin family serine protease